MRVIACLLVLFALVSCSGPVSVVSGEDFKRKAYQSSTMVRVEVKLEDNKTDLVTASAFAINKKDLVTAGHFCVGVIELLIKSKIATVTIFYVNPNEELTAMTTSIANFNIIAIDASNDLCVFTVPRHRINSCNFYR